MTAALLRAVRSMGAGQCASALLAVLLIAAHPFASAQPSVRSLDRFDDVAAWKAGASDGVTASVHHVVDAKRPALRLDFDLGGTAGYALARRALPIDLPDNYAITFWLRSDAPMNDLQVKLVDASGDNVWWYRRADFAFPREWQAVTIKKRHVEFAWGPTKDRTLRHVAAVEFVVAAGRDGGRGSVYVSDLELHELPAVTAEWPVPKVRASSTLRGSDAANALDGNVATAWQSNPAGGSEQWLSVDFGRPREFGGLVLRFAAGAHASRYDVQFSDDGRKWRTVRRVTEGGPGPAALLLTESETRHLRLAFHDGPKRSYALAEIAVQELPFGATPNAFFAALARDAPRGAYPRGIAGEQGAWTLVGVDGGSDTGLLSEDGALEIGRGGFTVEPFVVERGKVTTWAGVESRPFLVDDDLPMPGVQWTTPRWSLRITTFATGNPDGVRLVGRYDIANLTDQPLQLTLVLAVRPFQVNPPMQFLSTVGGASPIRALAWDGRALKVNGARSVYPLSAPARVALRPFDAGPLLPSLSTTDNRASRRDLEDEFGYASGTLFYPVTLAPRASATLGFAAPLTETGAAPVLAGRTPLQWLEREQAGATATWRGKLDEVTLRVPPEAQPLADTMRTALAHILVTRDGPRLRPGTRSYARSWIRDGTMIAESLMRLGHANVAADYLRWYAPHQFANGKVPCCIDARGADPVPENDSPGEFLFLAGEVYRYTYDRTLLTQLWPRLEAAADYMESLRQSERVHAGNGAPNPYFGMLPASISHEGYSAKPVHSYWDDFWALKGYESVVTLADALGRADDERRFTGARDEFRTDLTASLRATAEFHRIDYLPGSVELGDFDPTSSTIAYAPGPGARELPQKLVAPTFERYWNEFVARRDGRTPWDVYTPYELRNVATFVRLGWRGRAHELLEFFMAGRNPGAWNQWPEVVAHDLRKPLFVGDLPHAWVASDYVRSALDLFAYEDGDALVLAAGIPEAWLDDAADGVDVAVDGLRTPWGAVAYELDRRGDALRFAIDAGTEPPGGRFLTWPFGTPPGKTEVNGEPVAWLESGRLPLPSGETRVSIALD